MDVVADAGAVRRRIVGAENLELLPQPERRLDRNFDEVSCAFSRLSGAQVRVGAGDVEIAQDEVIEAVRDTRIAQHDLGHELRGAIGRHRRHRVILADRHSGGIAVNRRSGGKDELLDAALDGTFDQGVRVHRVVAVIAEGIRH